MALDELAKTAEELEEMRRLIEQYRPEFYRQIRNAYREGYSQTLIAEASGVSQSLVSKIVKGER